MIWVVGYLIVGFMVAAIFRFTLERYVADGYKTAPLMSILVWPIMLSVMLFIVVNQGLEKIFKRL
jgi:Na+(H+)/acetate symporter ActP